MAPKLVRLTIAGLSAAIIATSAMAQGLIRDAEIENTLRADVFDNVATDNTGGILVFDLPGLNQKNGNHWKTYI